MNPCVFCRILSQELPSARLCENELATAFLDIRPVNTGHVLVVPRRHVSSLTDLTEPETAAVFGLIRKVSSALKEEIAECAGITLSAANGEAAGQEVPHVHFHIIPRFSGDGFGWRRFGTLTNLDVLEATAISLRRHM